MDTWQVWIGVELVPHEPQVDKIKKYAKKKKKKKKLK
jgi:hypothetical protein